MIKKLDFSRPREDCCQKTVKLGRMRRSHNALEVVGTTTCKECGAVIKPHRVCKKCGSYKGNKVVEVKSAE